MRSRLTSQPHTVHRVLGATALSLGFALVMGSASCTTPATEVVGGFTTQIQVPKEIKAIAVIVTSGGRQLFCRGYDVANGEATLPSTLGVVPDADRDGIPAEAVKINVIGLRTPLSDTFETDCFIDLPDDASKDNVMIVRRASLQYSEERIVYTPLPLRESCADVHCENENETCVGGLCESAELDSAALADYRDDLIFGTSNTCFNPQICLADQATVPAVMTDPATCTFELKLPPDSPALDTQPGALNVEVLYASGGTEILDLDDREGFVFPDPSNPLVFRLADNMCQSQFLMPTTPKIVGVYASHVCPAKTPLQPICEEDLRGILQGARSPISISDGVEICSFGESLQATESALYVLMDRSRSMSEFFGPDGLQFAVDIPLQNPVAAATRVAFGFLPADMGDCDAGASYQNPMLPFADVTEQRGLIANLLGDANAPLADDPMLFLDAAMRGAYTALADLTPQTSATFNRKAVVLIGNRDFQTHCAGNMATTPAQLAATALADDQIYTYAAVLSAPPTADQYGDNPQTSAAAISDGGGTEVFDAVADEAQGALAVQSVLNDLGSCLYDPVDMSITGFITHLSFINPLTKTKTVIQENDACTSPDAAVDGFGYDAGGQVVICGAPCETLRSTLTDTASYYAVLGQTAPAVPILPGVSCDTIDTAIIDNMLP